MKHITIIGTSHIAKQSVKEVTTAIDEKKPDIVALELDRKRLAALLSPQKRRSHLRDLKRIGVAGYLLTLIGGWVEKKLGKLVGVDPGTEMLTAFHLAQKHKLRVALIDQDIEITLKKFSKAFTWREKFRLMGEVFKSLFRWKRKLPFDLRKVPKNEVINKMMEEVKVKYPSVYRVLITDRNRVMVRRLVHLTHMHPDDKILAIVGAGHLKGMLELLKKA